MTKHIAPLVPTEFDQRPSPPRRAPRVKLTSFERKMRAFLKEFALNKPEPLPDAPAQWVWHA